MYKKINRVVHVQSCFANLNLLLFDVLVTFAVLVSKLPKTFRGKLVKPVRRWLKSGIFYSTISQLTRD